MLSMEIEEYLRNNLKINISERTDLGWYDKSKICTLTVQLLLGDEVISEAVEYVIL